MEMKSLPLFGLIVSCLAIVLANTAPLEDNQDVAANSESKNYGSDFYWFVRPVYENEDEDSGYRAPSVKSNANTLAQSFVEVGSGWGR